MNPPTPTVRHPLAHAVWLGVLVLLAAACGDSEGGRSAGAESQLDAIVPAPPAEVPDFRPAIRTELQAPPSSPIEAIREYVSAEIERDGARSFALLSEAARTAAGSQADWIAASIQRPTIVDFTVDPATASGATQRSVATVIGTVTLEPRLDEVSGFVPAQADVDWQLVAEDGGWRVDIADTTLHPILPDEHGAARAAIAWARARQRCGQGDEYQGSLLGSPTLGDQLCDVRGDFVAATPGSLGDTLATEVVAAFGPDATTWARTVALSGAADLTVVTAPLGDRWVVVGVTG